MSFAAWQSLRLTSFIAPCQRTEDTQVKFILNSAAHEVWTEAHQDKVLFPKLNLLEAGLPEDDKNRCACAPGIFLSLLSHPTLNFTFSCLFLEGAGSFQTGQQLSVEYISPGLLRPARSLSTFGNNQSSWQWT